MAEILVSIVQRKVMPHQVSWGVLFAEGLKRHGVAHEIREFGRDPIRGNIVACWGWMVGQRMRIIQRRPVLVFERGYLGDRKEWISAGWNGLNNRATFAKVEDGGQRFREHFGHLIQPWRRGGGEYGLIMGQVDGDAALQNVNIAAWYVQAAASIKRRGLMAVFRPHPERPDTRGPGVPRICGTLDDALSKAALAVTYNSNSGVDAVLAGVPTIACDEGSMAWDVAGHGLDDIVPANDRSAWCAKLAWCQWQREELSNGFAWEHLRDAAHGTAS